MGDGHKACLRGRCAGYTRLAFAPLPGFLIRLPETVLANRVRS